MAGSVRATLTCLSLALAGCDAHHEAPADPVDHALAELRAFENGARANTDFAHLPPSDALFGPDPYRIACLDDGRAVSVLRGASRVALLGGRVLAELGRIETPASPTALTIDRERIFVAGEHGPTIAEYRASEHGLTLLRSFAAPLANVRDLAFADGRLYAVSDAAGELAIVDPERPADARVVTGFADPIRVAARPPYVIVDELLGHSLALWRADDGSIVRIRHDGPLWSFAARARGGDLEIVALGVEDHPLDRRGGFFGNIDSFAFHYRVRPGQAPERLAELNLSAYGVVTPKAAVWLDDERLLVTGYGGERAAVLRAADSLVFERGFDAPPGINDLVECAGTLIAANPLLDAWIPLGSGAAPLPAEQTLPPASTLPFGPGPRLGEALIFTTMMAPMSSSEGAHSRFSCETCHFEGGVDGRAHHTGRGDVHATTKPLFGLFNNGPHFTRALDPDLTKVAHAEFRVAGAASGYDPWFALDSETHPWLRAMTGVHGSFQPAALRRAIVEFFMRFSHRTNTRVIGKASFDPLERAGAVAFRERCAGCHAARLVTRDAASEVPFDAWEKLVLSEAGPIVWASDGYNKTGVEPYVHPDGARTSSLRRISAKRPYFTNGSAPALDDVLERARVHGGGGFRHDGGDGKPLAPEEQRALLAFLRLL